MTNTRKCPKCNKDLFYKEKKSLNLANRKKSNCLKCTQDVNNEKQRKFDLSFLLNENNESFYWIGLLLADGYITNTEISLCLHKKDKVLIDKFQNKCNNPNINIKGDSLRIAIKDKIQVLEFVTKFKIISPKTYNPVDFNVFKVYSKDLLYSLLIGLIDGDGCIQGSLKHHVYSVGLTFHKCWLNFYKQLFDFLNIPYNFRFTDNTICFRISRKSEIIKLYRKMLQLNITYLNRKWDKINKF